MKIYHYGILTKSISEIAALSLLFLCFINPGWILITLFFLPFLILFTLWTLIDSTKIEVKDGVIEITERKRILSDKFKFHRSKVIKLKVIQQGFVDKATKSQPWMPMAAFDQVQSDTKAYTKAMIAIQTKRRVIRIGKTFNEKEIKQAYNFLKEAIGK